MKTNKKRSGRFMFLKNLSSLLGPQAIYGDSIAELNLTAQDKINLNNNQAVIFESIKGKITCITGIKINK